jgi:integrase
MAMIEERVGKDGRVRYRVRIRLRGRPPVSETFDRRTDARIWAQKTESDLRRARQFPQAAARHHTVSDAIDRYLQHMSADLPSRRMFAGQLGWWKQQIGGVELLDLTAGMIAQQRDKLRAQGAGHRPRIADATVNRYLAALSIVLSKAWREWEWIDATPMAKVSRLREPRGRTRALTQGEIEALMTACRNSANPHLATVVSLALGTAARKMEILGLRWTDVDLERGRVIFRKTKNGDQRSAPLAGSVRVALERHRTLGRHDGGLLFPSPRKPDRPVAIQAAWERALRDAGISDFRFHDLRHTSASLLAMSGSTLAEIAAITGHKTLAMVKRYSHLTDTHNTQVVTRMTEKFLDGALGKEPRND